MRDQARKAGVYLASANWQHITYLAVLAIGTAHFLTPIWATVIVPALAHHWVQALVAGRQALAEATYGEWLKFRGFSDEQAERWAEEEVGETLSVAAKDIPKVDE